MSASSKINPSKINSFLSEGNWGVIIILLLSLIARWVLVLRGGQYYFSDEGRYETSRSVAILIQHGNLREAFTQFFIAPEHLGFKFLGIFPALVERFTLESLLIPGLFFSIFSVLNVYLIYLISIRAGASHKEAFYALLLAAVSMPLLYYARHLMPYDPALTFGLLAIYTGLDQKSTTRASILCGLFGFLCFITYNGYWTLAVGAMLLTILRQWRGITNVIRTGALTAIGFIVPTLTLAGLSSLAGVNLVDEYRTFSTTVSQGSYSEGWSLPFEYFWHADHLIFFALMGLSLFAVYKPGESKHRVWLWAGAAVFIYLCLVSFSVYLHAFVVYGRLARQITPFLILLAANGLVRLEQVFPAGQLFARALLAIIVIQFAWNYMASYDLSYPREFAWRAQLRFPDFEFSEKRLIFGAPTLCQNNGYIAEYVKRFELPPEANPPIVGEILLVASHPDNFLPYQYEGYTYQQRIYLRKLRPEMRLYKASDNFMSESNPVWADMKNCWVNENSP